MRMNNQHQRHLIHYHQALIQSIKFKTRMIHRWSHLDSATKIRKHLISLKLRIFSKEVREDYQTFHHLSIYKILHRRDVSNVMWRISMMIGSWKRMKPREQNRNGARLEIRCTTSQAPNPWQNSASDRIPIRNTWWWWSAAWMTFSKRSIQADWFYKVNRRILR